MAVTTFHLFFVVAFVALHVVCGMDEMIIWMTMLVVEDVVLVSSGVKWKWQKSQTLESGQFLEHMHSLIFFYSAKDLML